MSPHVFVAILVISVFMEGVVTLRAPVSEYAGLVSKHQAVLIDPTNLSKQIIAVSTEKGDVSEENDEVFEEKNGEVADSVAESPTIENLPSPSALQSEFSQKFMNTRRSRSNTTSLRRRLFRPIPGRRTGGWRRRAGGLAPVSASGLSRLGGGISLANLHQLPSMANLQPISSESRKQIIQQNLMQFMDNRTNPTTTTVQPTTDFLSKWHNTYSHGQASQTKKSSAILSSKLIKNNLSQPTTPSTLLRNTEEPSDSLVKKIMKNPEPKDSFTPSSRIPSVHDMTSFHFADSSNKLQGNKTPNDTQSHNRREVRPRIIKTTTTPSTTTAESVPPITKKPAQNAAHDSEILESIKTIVRSSAQSNDYSSLKFFNGNPSPSPLDIFAGVKPIYGFKPSFQHSSGMAKISSSTKDKTLSSPTFLQAASSISVSHSDKPVRPNIGPNAFNAGPTIIVTAPPLGQDIALKVGHYLPVMQDMSSNPSRLEVRTLQDNDIVIGRPAALIQAPTPESTLPISKMPPTLRNSEGTPMILYNEEHYETTQQPTYDSSPFPFWHPPELAPVVEMIKKRYENKNAEIPLHSFNSAMRLKSLIEKGEVSEYFNKDHLIDYIRNDQTKFHSTYPVDRLGEPFRSALLDRENPEAGITGQFVALSGLALLMAFGGYYLFSSNPVKESRGVQDPLLNAVGQARHGLQLLQQGLDEYETKLIEKKDNLNDETLPQKSADSNINLPHLDAIKNNFKNIWEAVQGIPNKIANDITVNDASPFSKAIKGFNKNLQSKGLFGAVQNLLFDKLAHSPPSSREPHKLDFHNDLSPEVIQREESDNNVSLMDLFNTSSLSENAVLNILSQLISPGAKGDNEEFNRNSRAKEKEISGGSHEEEEEEEDEEEIDEKETGSYKMSFLESIFNTFTRNSNQHHGQMSLLQQMAAEFKSQNANSNSKEAEAANKTTLNDPDTHQINDETIKSEIVNGQEHSIQNNTESVERKGEENEFSSDTQVHQREEDELSSDTLVQKREEDEFSSDIQVQKQVTVIGDSADSTENPSTEGSTESIDQDPTDSTVTYDDPGEVTEMKGDNPATTSLQETTTVSTDDVDSLETTEETPQDGLTVTPQLVFINNLLHAPHNPDTEPPRNGAYLRNRPFKRLS